MHVDMDYHHNPKDKQLGYSFTLSVRRRLIREVAGEAERQRDSSLWSLTYSLRDSSRAIGSSAEGISTGGRLSYQLET